MRDMKTRIAKQIIFGALEALRNAYSLLCEPEIPYGFRNSRMELAKAIQATANALDEINSDIAQQPAEQEAANDISDGAIYCDILGSLCS